MGDTGLRATAPVISDLLVEDLSADGATLRKEVPRLLEELVEEGRVVDIGDEFRLQTEEGAEWTKGFNQRRASIRDDAARMSQLRNEWLLKAVDDELAGLEARAWRQQDSSKIRPAFGATTKPTVDGTSIPLWIRDEWNVTDTRAKEDAAKTGNESPIVYVLLPRIDADAIRDALASYAAATDTITQRPTPQTDEGRQAKQGMQSRVQEGERRLESLFGTVVAKARVFSGWRQRADNVVVT